MSRSKYFGLACAAELGIVLAMGASAFAQAPATAPNPPTIAGQGGGELQQITVTGYIAPRIGDGTQPVLTLDRDFMQKQGEQTVSDVLQRLPQNVGSFTPIVNAGASFSPGGSEVNLYGLGFGTTLVLIDGYRQTLFPFPQNGFEPFVDLNSIPLAAVDRIEILKDGASSLYGSDAIAGVVNIILKNEYNGADISYHFGISQRDDFVENHVQLVAGVSHKLWDDDSKLSILVTFDYDDTSPIDANSRWYSNNVDHTKYSSIFTDERSSRTPAGNFFGLTTGNSFALIPGTLGPTVTPADFVINGALNKYQTIPGAQLIPREQRISTYDKITFQPDKWVQVYDEFIYERTQEDSSFTALPVTETDNVTVPASNPFNPFGEDLQWRGRLLQLGQRKNEAVINTYRNLAGVRLISLPQNWYVDASFLYAESDGTQTASNGTLNSRLNQALSGTLPGFVGTFYNPFIDTNANPNPEFTNALRYSQHTEARTDLTQWSIRGGGDLFYLCSGPVTVGGGAEYRSESYIAVQDPNLNIHNITAAGTSQNSSGKDYVKSVYGQIIIPLLGEKWSWPGARALELDISERYDDYSSFGSAAKPKFAIRYKPFDDLTFRASYSESFRAPSLPELFTGTTTGFQFVTDPVTGTTSEVQVLGSGNPHLHPETGYSYYAGAVWTPGAADPEHSWWGWLNGFTAYIDWIEISRRNVIQEPSPQFIVNTEATNPNFVIRGTGNQIVTVLTPFQNLGAERVDAIDFGGSYVTKEYFWGKLDLEVNASWLYHVSEQDQPGGQVFNVTDSLGGSIFTGPDFRMVTSAFYSKTVFGCDTFRTGLTLNYMDSEHDVNDPRAFGLTLQEFVAATGLANAHVIGNWTTFDWQISYEVGKFAEIVPETPKPGYDKEGKRILGEKAISPKPEAACNEGWRRWLGGTKLTFGINNIFDTRPPFSDFFTEGFDTAHTTPFQRYFYVEVEKKF
ncbi:MAG TPA: TonB-dependent receptor [Chthoniobacterales bacterium]|nr:TonB-dependent receptor [Chthoniobacterales bacterium]